MRNLFFILIFVFLLISSCTKEKDPTVHPFRLRDTTTVKIGHTYINRKYNMTFKMDSVLDFRCPIEYFCLLEGPVYVKLNFTASGKNAEFRLPTDSNYKPDTTLFRFQVRLIDITGPRPSINHPVDQSEYSARIVINAHY